MRIQLQLRLTTDDGDVISDTEVIRLDKGEDRLEMLGLSLEPQEAATLEDRLDRIKWRLWHGDGRETLIRLDTLAEDIDVLKSDYPNLERFAKTVAEFATYIRNNVGLIPNYGERWRNGELISTSFVESTVNVLISKRFCKKQQMQWTPEGAHLLLQTRAQTLDGALRGIFEKWYPGLAANDSGVRATAAAA